MIGRKLMLSGLHKQRRLLDLLIEDLQSYSSCEDAHVFLESRAEEVANNLKRLREIKDGYFRYELQ